MPAGAFVDGQIAANRPTDQFVGNTNGYSAGARALWDSDIVISGNFTNEFPVTLLTQNFSGAYVCSFFDDYYNVIYVLPTVIDFGAVGNETTNQFYIFNAYLTPQTMASITEVNTDGLVLVGAVPPVVFRPTAVRLYNLTAELAGPALIDALYTFNFPTDNPTLRVSGSRATLSRFDPNWDNPYTMIFEYKTDILTVDNGREQRRATREHPRIGVEFSMLETDQQMRDFSHLVLGSQNNKILVQDYSRKLTTTLDLPASTLTVTVDETPYWLVPDLTVVISTKENRETRVVESVLGNTITFAGQGENDFLAGTFIRPALSCRFRKDVTINMLTNTVGRIPVRFDAIPGDIIRPPVPVADTFLNGTEVFTRKPNYEAGVEITIEAGRDVVDFDRGVDRLFENYAYPTRKTKLKYSGLAPETTEELIGFFMRQRGRQGQFYMPSWTSDMVLRQGIVLNGNSIQVEGDELFGRVADSPIHRGIVINLADGTKLYREVDLIYLQDDGGVDHTTIQVTDPFPATVPLDEITDVSWLYFTRFGADSLTVEFLTNTVSDMKLNFYTVAKD